MSQLLALLRHPPMSALRPLSGERRTLSRHRRMTESVESPGGISPRALPKPCVNLSIHTAPDVRPLAHKPPASPRPRAPPVAIMASVGPWPRLNNAAPSVQPHYRAFIPTTGHSAPVLRIGT